MEIQLSEDLERFVRDQVRAGRFASEAEVVRSAVECLKRTQAPTPSGEAPAADPWLGSMREDAGLLDEIVEDAMMIREERPWRPPVGE